MGILKARIRAVTGTEPVVLSECAGRVLAADVAAAHPVPAHTNAAVDGYAFQASADTRANGVTLGVMGRAAAGHPFEQATLPETAVRIFTGAVMPEATNTVVMQEDVTVRDGVVAIPPGLKPGANVRSAGEDVTAGAVLFRQGHVLRPQDLAALASVGSAEVDCFQRVRIGVVSTGDEVVAPGAGALRPGQVYDANSSMLVALLRSAGAEVEVLGIWPDHRATVTARLRDAAQRFDVIITSGGASMGDEDHMAAALASMGQRHLWQLAIKPGRPMMFGQISIDSRDTVVVGLPGNPVAVFVCCLMYVLPMVRTLGGARWREPRRFMLPAAFTFTGRKQGRREFWRGMLVERDGQMAVDKFARDGSGLISGLTAADGLIDIGEDHGDVAVGDLVPFIPMTEFAIV